MIVVSYDRLPDLRFEAVVFLDTDSGDCFQIQRDLMSLATTEASTHQISTGMGAPIPEGILHWRRVDDRFEFALTTRAARIFGGSDVLSFDVEPADGSTVDEIADHVERLLR